MSIQTRFSEFVKEKILGELKTPDYMATKDRHTHCCWCEELFIHSSYVFRFKGLTVCARIGCIQGICGENKITVRNKTSQPYRIDPNAKIYRFPEEGFWYYIKYFWLLWQRPR